VPIVVKLGCLGFIGVGLWHTLDKQRHFGCTKMFGGSAWFCNWRCFGHTLVSWGCVMVLKRDLIVYYRSKRGCSDFVAACAGACLGYIMKMFVGCHNFTGRCYGSE